MKAFALILGLVLSAAVVTPSVGQAEIITIGGEQYECTKLGTDGNCWDKCPYSFSSCVSSCGGGQGCWDKCPYSFTSCASSCGTSPASACWDKCPYSFSSCHGTCGGGSSCWDKCPYSFSSCQASCGTNGMPTKDVFEKTANERKLRIEKQKLKELLNFD
jgi:hypothetical protein